MVRAASSSARSMVSSIGISSRTTKGMVTKRVASAIPVPDKDKSLAISKECNESRSREGGKQEKANASIMSHMSVDTSVVAAQHHIIMLV